MTDADPIFETGDYLRQAFYDQLPARYQGLSPDLAAAQLFNLQTRSKMSFHSDSWPGNGKPMDTEIGQEQGAPIITLNLFFPFNFWVIPVVRGDAVDTKQRLDHRNEDCVTLADGDAMLWVQEDDHAFQHGVWPVRKSDGGPMEGWRVSIVWRWRWPGAEKKYSLECPYRVIKGAVPYGDLDCIICTR